MDAAIFPHSSDTYNSTSMFSFALASTGNLKPGLLGIAPNIPTLAHLNQVCRVQAVNNTNTETLTPPYQPSAGVSNSPNNQSDDFSSQTQSRDSPNKEKPDAKATLYQQLSIIEQSFVNKTPVHISHLLALGVDKQVRNIFRFNFYNKRESFNK